MIILVTTWTPPDKSGEMMKKFTPLDKAQLAKIGIKKWMVFGVAARSGNKGYHLIFIEKDKVEDAMKAIAKMFVTDWKIAGFRMRVEYLSTMNEIMEMMAGWDKL